MTNIAVQHELSTPEGFARRVKISRASTNGAAALIGLSIVAIIYNLVSTFRTMDEYPGAPFFRVFFSTQGETPADTVWFTIIIFAPLILLPVALGFFIYAKVTAARVKQQTFEDFRANGYIARQDPIGLGVQVGNDKNLQTVVVVSHPAVPDEQYHAAVAALRQAAAIPEKKAAKQLAKTVAKAGIAKATSTAVVAPGLPPELFLTVERKGSEHVVVIPAAAGAKPTSIRILPVSAA